MLPCSASTGTNPPPLTSVDDLSKVYEADNPWPYISVGTKFYIVPPDTEALARELEAQIATARAEERERCAETCAGTFSPHASATGCCDAALDKAAAAIRALKD